MDYSFVLNKNKQIKMKKIHGKMMKGITSKSLMMLLALAGSSYCHAQQATIVVAMPTSTHARSLSLST